MDEQRCFKNSHKTLFIFSAILQIFGGLMLFIISFIWFSRISPYFSSGIGVSYWIYFVLQCQIIYLCFAFVVFLVIIIVYARIIKCDKTKFLNVKAIIIFCILGIFFWAPVIGTGFWLSSQAIKKGNSLNNKCYSYIFFGLLGADSTYSQPEYKKWRNDFIKNAFDENENLTQYLCENVSIPTLVSALAFLVAFVLQIICIFLACRNCLSNNGFVTVDITFSAPLIFSHFTTNQGNAYT